MLSAGVVAGWRLDEATGSSRIDVRGASTMLQVAADVPSAPGKTHNAARFLNDGNFLARSSEVPVGSGSFSLSCWVNWTVGGGAAGTCVGRQTGSNQMSLIVLGASGRPRFSVNGGVFTEVPSLPSGQWTHLALSHDNNIPAFKSYRNGVLVATTATTASSVNAPDMAIGVSLTALVEEAYVWNRALNEAEVARLYSISNAGMSHPWNDGKSFM